MVSDRSTPEAARSPATRPLARAAVVALWAAVAAPWAWRTRALALDDFFVTYRYAWNLSHGRGFVFNLGEHVFGLTCPGFGLLLGVLSGPWHADIPSLATLLYAASLLLLPMLLSTERDAIGRGWAVAAGLLIASSSFLWKSQGSETVPALVLLLLAARWAESRPGAAGTVAASAVFFRPESALALGILGLLRWREARTPPWRFAGAAAAVLGGGAVACRLAFDTWLPLTLRSKRSLASMDGSNERFWSDAWQSWARHEPTLAAGLVALALAGLVLLVWRGGRGARLLGLYAVSLVVAYTALGVPYFVWYVVPLAVAVYCGVAALGATLWQRAWTLRASLPRGTALAALGVATLCAVGVLVRDRVAIFRATADDARLVAYREAATWIREHSSADARVAYVEIGVLSYYGDRSVDDLLGLVTPRSLPFAERRDLEGAFLAQPSEFVLHHDGRGRMRAIVNKPWFRAAYDEVFAVDSPDGDGRVHVFQRRPGSSVPPPRAPRGGAEGTP